MRRLVAIVACCWLAAALPASAGEAGRYLSGGEFLADAFAGPVPDSSTLWIRGDLRDEIETVLGHRFGALRVRYWQDGTTSAWILDEIGKELPITIGVSVTDGEIGQVRILEFRESRGWEVRYPFFTDQFRNARLASDGDLDRKIDGITGATLSVKAVSRIARVALILHETVSRTG